MVNNGIGRNVVLRCLERFIAVTKDLYEMVNNYRIEQNITSKSSKHQELQGTCSMCSRNIFTYGIIVTVCSNNILRVLVVNALKAIPISIYCISNSSL